jgi:hypothetical protein
MNIEHVKKFPCVLQTQQDIITHFSFETRESLESKLNKCFDSCKKIHAKTLCKIIKTLITE